MGDWLVSWSAAQIRPQRATDCNPVRNSHTWIRPERNRRISTVSCPSIFDAGFSILVHFYNPLAYYEAYLADGRYAQTSLSPVWFPTFLVFSCGRRGQSSVGEFANSSRNEAIRSESVLLSTSGPKYARTPPNSNLTLGSRPRNAV